MGFEISSKPSSKLNKKQWPHKACFWHEKKNLWCFDTTFCPTAPLINQRLSQLLVWQTETEVMLRLGRPRRSMTSVSVCQTRSCDNLWFISGAVGQNVVSKHHKFFFSCQKQALWGHCFLFSFELGLELISNPIQFPWMIIVWECNKSCLFATTRSPVGRNIGSGGDYCASLHPWWSAQGTWNS